MAHRARLAPDSKAVRKRSPCPIHRDRAQRCECGVYFRPCCEGRSVCSFCAAGGGDDQYRALAAAHPVLRAGDSLRPVRNTYSRIRRMN